jgi:tetratricopeptide (TPR) repeat protein
MKSDLNLGIYDLGILPYALGDVLTWCMKHRIRGILDRRPKNRVLVCASADRPAGIHQAHFITRTNFHGYLVEILPAFLALGDDIDLRIVSDRKACWREMDALGKESSRAARAYHDYRRTWELRTRFSRCRAFFERHVSSHEDINAHAAEAGDLPWLAMPSGIRHTVRDIRDDINPQGVFVALNFRCRANDVTADASEIDRDADQRLWLDLVEHARHALPHVTFVLLGKLAEKPDRLFHQPNVYIPRVFGASLAEELAWVNEADGFLGSSSGFAAMANFGVKPYLVTKIGPAARRFFAIRAHADRLPFARDNQRLVEGEGTEKQLVAFLESLPSSCAARATHPAYAPVQKVLEATRQATQLRCEHTLAAAEREFLALSEAGAMQAAHGLLEGRIRRLAKTRGAQLRYHLLRARHFLLLGAYGTAKEDIVIAERLGASVGDLDLLRKEANANLLLENIDRFLARNPDADAAFCGVGLVRARAFSDLGQHEDALEAVQEHLRLFPADAPARKLEASIAARIRKSNRP